MEEILLYVILLILIASLFFKVGSGWHYRQLPLPKPRHEEFNSDMFGGCDRCSVEGCNDAVVDYCPDCDSPFCENHIEP